MQVKKDILWRVYLCYVIIALIGIAVIGKAFYIQQVQGAFWTSKSDSLHTRVEQLHAERGTIYSSDGEMLSTSVPQFDIYVDFSANGLVLLNTDHKDSLNAMLDSLSYHLSNLFKDKTQEEYKSLFAKGLKKGNRYTSLKKKVSFDQYQQLKTFPLVRLGKYKSGFIYDVKNIRLNPYDMLAYRTIGLDRINAQKVGLEQTYDTVLTGTDGQRVVRYISKGVSIPVDEEMQTDSKNGKDIVTTIDTRIQEIAENALLKMMKSNEAENGCAIVIEVATGKVKAIANLGRRPSGEYWEDFNYAVSPSEPGSTFKLASLISVIEDKKYTINSAVNLQGGVWSINGRTVYDSEKHGLQNVNVKRAFEVSSNVGMAKLVYNSYASNPSLFINHLRKFKMDTTTGIDLYGERLPVIYQPKSKYWSATTLPWMAFGYNIAITPMHTAMLYNAVANNGKLMKPYLLESIQQDGNILKSNNGSVISDSICSAATLSQVRACLEGVCAEPGATGFKLFKGSLYKVAGKTGTALVANGNRGYTDHIYQSSFAGYFPADNPQYTCVVVIKNKPHAVLFYGASVAGPVFKEIADRLVTMNVKQAAGPLTAAVKFSDSAYYSYAGKENDIKYILNVVKLPYRDSSITSDNWAVLSKNKTQPVLQSRQASTKQMPQLKGLSAKDAVYLCEVVGLQVQIKGMGRVVTQSVVAGSPIARGQQIKIELGS